MLPATISAVPDALTFSCRSATLVVSVFAIDEIDSVSFSPPVLQLRADCGNWPAGPPADFDCAIDGSVVNALTGEPIPRARISINTSAASSSAAADSSGKWSLSNVACGTTPVTVTRPGFLQKASRPVTLRSGSAVHDVKMELTPQSVFYGKVVDDQGDPVVGARDRHLRIAGRGWANQFSASGRGEHERSWRVPCRGPASREIHSLFQPCQGPTRAGEPTAAEACYPGPVEGGAATAMEIPAGRETRVDLAMIRRPPYMSAVQFQAFHKDAERDQPGQTRRQSRARRNCRRGE